MEHKLTPVEVRILGSLVEKELTTPEYYPLTLNSLVSACNQKSNRHPVMSLSSKEVENTLEDLKDKRMVWQMSLAGSRVPKYEHNLKSLYSFDDNELALLSVLMLRGPQTVGELRARTERMVKFTSLDEVENVLQVLSGKEGGPFVQQITRKAGQKENRYVQLFSEEEVGEISQENQLTDMESADVQPRLSDRVALLEGEVNELRNEMAIIKEDFNELKRLLE
ncbi:YceH family protein [Chitinispirillales bacterium ANBcel5]|uniref:YceH family protein n=1 Tax=Cellulosispirillum alkaliphilum TaxID=3039283 RepID=UPI002A51AD1B|nr:YceH family protein [Chitinispirillales bacterium ANBcel5]